MNYQRPQVATLIERLKDPSRRARDHGDPQGREAHAPLGTRTDVMCAYAISKLGWIRRQQAEFRARARETPRRYVTRETHWLWGKRYLLRVEYVDARPAVVLDHRQITLRVRRGSDRDARAALNALPLGTEPSAGIGVLGQRLNSHRGICAAAS